MSFSRVQLSDGATLSVKILGDDRSKPLLIVLHGAPGLSDHKEPESSFGFLQSQFRVLVYDARGSGSSDLKEPYTDERWAADVEELRIWAGAEKFILAGGSYGGFVALTCALAFPSRLIALILRDTWAWGSRAQLNALKEILTSDRLNVDAERQLRVWSGTLRDDHDFEEAFKEILPIYAPPSSGKSQKDVSSFEGEKVVLRKRVHHSATQNAAFAFNVPRFDVRERLKEIKVPTLVVVGRHDLIAPVAYSEEISAGIPNAELAVFEHSGHSPPSDEPEAFKERVSKFLTSLSLWVESPHES